MSSRIFKYSYSIVAKELAVSAKQTEERGLADAVIVTGKETGSSFFRVFSSLGSA
jgi:predicted TIM-barrel enzyme